VEEDTDFMFPSQICSGGDLDALINQRGLTMDYFPEVDIWIYAAQIVDALDYLHNSSGDKTGRNLMHRDLKPANSECHHRRVLPAVIDHSFCLSLLFFRTVFLADNQRELHLGDFGLATWIPKDGVVTGDVGVSSHWAREVGSSY
jgi:serine/threonine protein kinase